MLMADALGAGPSADHAAAAVLAAFRAAAPCEADLAALARHLHAALAPGDDAVRALLLSAREDGEHLDMVGCGHPPPLLARDGYVSRPDAVPVHPPLGLLQHAAGGLAPATVPCRPGDRVFVHSNGVSEARDGDGVPYPFEERLAANTAEDTDTMLDAVMAGLLAHAGGRLTDGAELLAISRAAD
ncbi:PP2C family protein-serine/threonine phosphatase [Spirillospora albida]|uniref:PP2C family protein-serine/threonine phosphatase n=1 Tax=Spirillospora albida TaxID=58123 RepID=UPI0024810737|nr:PP2C family protein-serine/threonine phosphatase [Spirillospora albida]